MRYFTNTANTVCTYRNVAWRSELEISCDEYFAWLLTQSLKRQLITYQDLLRETDYIPLKIIEGVATAEDYAEDLAQRQQWREKIRELEQQLSATASESIEK